MAKVRAVIYGMCALLFLSGCSVPIVGQAGITVEDGQVFGVVKMCRTDETVHSLELTPDPGEWFFIPRPTWDFDETSDARVDLGSINDFVDLIDDRDVMISPKTNGSIVGSVYFDEDTIVGLRDGEIVTQIDREVAIISESEFDDIAAAYCD